MPAIFELVVAGLCRNVRAMGFWISAIIALLLAGLATPPVAQLHSMKLPAPEVLALLAMAFAVAGLLSRSKRSRVSN